MVDLREMSNFAAQLHEKNHQGNSHDAHRPQRPQGPPGELSNFLGVGKGGLANPCPGIFPFWGRDVGAVKPAASLAEKECRYVGRDAIRCDRPLKLARNGQI